MIERDSMQKRERKRDRGRETERRIVADSSEDDVDFVKLLNFVLVGK